MVTRMQALGSAALTALVVAPAQQGAASGFQLREGSAAAQGMSLAGRASHARDVSFVLGNPAALRGVQGFEVSGGIAGLAVFSEGTVPGDRATLQGDPEGDAGLMSVIPSLAVGYRFSEKFVLGLTVDAPYGLGNGYDSDWAGAADGIDSELLTVAVTPMISFQPIPQLAIAGGITVQYADARLSNAVPPFPPGNEGELSGDDIALGFIVGAAWDPFPGTSLGIRYRSAVDHTLEGEFSDNYAIQAPPPFGLIPIPGSDGTASFTLPASVNFGFTQAVGERWRIMAEAEYTDWSAYDAIVIEPDAPSLTIRDEQNYESTWMGAVGFEYDWSDALTLRSGVAFDLTPATDRWRTTRVPDADRFWWSAGFSYEISERFGIDAAYTLIAIPDTPEVTFRHGPNAGRVAEYESMIHLIGINGRYRF